MKFFRLILILLINISILINSSCTKEKIITPTLEKYKEDTELMLNICSKFQLELDPNKLHKVAVSMQESRVISCANFNNECNIYGDFLNIAVEVSSDGIITHEERKKMELQLLNLKAAIKEGLFLLKTAHD